MSKLNAGGYYMKNTYAVTPQTELAMLKKQIEITERKLDFVTDTKLIAALSYELLSLRARIGYIIDCAKASYM